MAFFSLAADVKRKIEAKKAEMAFVSLLLGILFMIGFPSSLLEKFSGGDRVRLK